MDLFRLAQAIRRHACPAIARVTPTLAGAGLAAVSALTSSHPALADKISNPIAVFNGLDKITGRIISFEVAINETVQFGALQITPRVCYSRPPTDAPQTDAFAQVDEIDEQKQMKRIFSGWMFADSPGLHGIEHPVYDIWLTDCKGDGPLIHEAPEVVEAPVTPDSPPDAGATPAPTDAKPQPPPKKRKPKPPPLSADAPIDLGNGPLSGRNPPSRQFFPADSTPNPPANIGR